MISRTTNRARAVAVSLVAALVAALTVGICAASSASAHNTAHSRTAHAASGVIYSGSGTVTFLIYDGAVSRWLGVDTPNLRADLKKYAPNITFQTENANGSASTQLQQAQSVALKGTKGIIITPAQTDPQSIVNVTSKDHIPMVVLEGLFSGLKPGSVAGLVSPAPNAIGEAEADYVISRVKKGSEIAILDGDMSGQFAIVEHDGIEAALKTPAAKAKDLKVVADKSTPDWATSAAEAEAAGVLTATHNKVAAFLGGNDDVATGAIQALQKVGLAKKVLVVGMGAEVSGAKNILQGTEASTTSWNIATEDNLAAQVIAYKIAGKTVPKTVFDSTYNDGQGNFPFAVAPVFTLGRSQINKVIQYGGLTIKEVCQGLAKSVGAPCA